MNRYDFGPEIVSFGALPDYNSPAGGSFNWTDLFVRGISSRPYPKDRLSYPTRRGRGFSQAAAPIIPQIGGGPGGGFPWSDLIGGTSATLSNIFGKYQQPAYPYGPGAYPYQPQQMGFLGMDTSTLLIIAAIAGVAIFASSRNR